jgi:hypothetical protein
VKVENAKVMTLGDRKSGGHRYITVELERSIDMDTVPGIQYNLVPACDWVNVDIPQTINGRHIEFDISQQIQQGGMQSVQSVYIDNGPNNCAFTIEVMSTKYRVTCAPNKQGWFPLICAAKDGRFRIGAVDKYNQLGNGQPSWYLPASASLQGFAVTYKPSFIFTDLAVPPATWDCRQLTTFMAPFNHVFAGTGIEQLVITGSNRRFGIRFHSLCENWASMRLYTQSNIDGSINQFDRLYPGESLTFEGENAPVDAFYAAVQNALGVGDALHVYVQT